MRPRVIKQNGIMNSDRLFSPRGSLASLRPGAAAFLAGMCLLVAACSDTQSPPLDTVGHVYVLVSVNGEELPHRFWEDAISANELVADTLVFRDVDSVAYYRTTRWVTDDGHRSFSNSDAKAYEQLPSGRVRITKVCPMFASWCREDYIENGVFRGDTLITSIDNIDISEDRVYVLLSVHGYP